MRLSQKSLAEEPVLKEGKLGKGHFLPYSERNCQAENYAYRRYFPMQYPSDNKLKLLL